MHTCNLNVCSSPPSWRHFSLPQPALANQHPHKVFSLYHAHGLELHDTCGCCRKKTRRESSERRKVNDKEHGGGRERETGPGFPFNLLINHANEILTGYSEAFLRGVWKELVPDYTLSM